MGRIEGKKEGKKEVGRKEGREGGREGGGSKERKKEGGKEAGKEFWYDSHVCTIDILLRIERCQYLKVNHVVHDYELNEHLSES